MLHFDYRRSCPDGDRLSNGLIFRRDRIMGAAVAAADKSRSALWHALDSMPILTLMPVGDFHKSWVMGWVVIDGFAMSSPG